MGDRPNMGESPKPPVTHGAISDRAEKIWEDAGKPAGADVEEWLRAEKDLRNEAGRAGEPKAAGSGGPHPKPDDPNNAPALGGMKLKNALPLLLVLLAAVALTAAITWWLVRPEKPADELILYGNVDLRQVELPFNNSERIAEVLVQEGDHVRQGQVLARLETARLLAQVAEADAEVAGQHASVERLLHGSRPEEVALANANVLSATADVVNAQKQWERLTALSGRTGGRAMSQVDLDNAKAALDVAAARLTVNQKTADLSRIGPRIEDIDLGEAQLRAAEARLDFLHQEVKDADLLAPIDAVVRSRLMEPGEIATPQKPVLTLSITQPKWVRAYLSEPDLAKIRPGMAATVTADGFPNLKFTGRVGFISSDAEFTPKSVETVELRSQLVYEIRVFVMDPSDDLRLGMPATVHLALNSTAAK
jgi:HlyD family secretion protein